MDAYTRDAVVAKARDLLPKYGGAGNGGELMALNQASLVLGVVTQFDPTSVEAKAMVRELQDGGCPFCEFALSPERVFDASTDCWIVKSRSPRAELHLLVIPRVHFPTLDAADPATLAAMMRAIQGEARTRGLRGYRVVVNVGDPGKQSVFHLHAHLLSGPEVVADGFARSVGESG